MVLGNDHTLYVYEKDNQGVISEPKIIFNRIENYITARDMSIEFEKKDMSCAIYRVNKTQKEKTYTLMYKSKV